MKNQRTRGIILSYVSLGINTIVNLLYVPILIHYLGKSQYGLYQLMGSFIAYFSVMDFGLSNTIVRYYSKYHALNDERQMENVLATAQKIYSVVNLLIIIVGGVIYAFLDVVYNSSLSKSELTSAKQIYVIVIINVIITVSTNVYTAVINANERFVFLKSLSLVQTLLQPFVVIIVISQKPYALSVVIVQTILNLLTNIIKIIYSYKTLRIKIKSHGKDVELIKGMLKFSGSIFIVAITDQLFWKTNQLILGAVAGTVAVAVYSVASQIYMNYVSLSSVIQGVFLPRITELVTRREDVNDTFLQIGRIQYMLLSCIWGGFVVFGKEFIGLWVGEDFSQAYYITLIIITGMTIDLIQSIGGTIMQAKNMYSIRAKILLVMAIFNIGIAIVVAKRYGGIGCAVGTCICMIIGNGFAMNYIYQTKVRLNIAIFWKNIIHLTIPALLTLLIGNLINAVIGYGGFLLLGIKILIYVLIYIILLWVMGLDKYEKEVLVKVWKKRRH